MKKRKIPLNSIRSAIIGILLVVLGMAIGVRFSENGALSIFSRDGGRINFNLTNLQAPSQYKDVDFGQFWEAWGILSNDFLNEEQLDQEKMVEGAISGMTAALGDPYTVYLPPEGNQRAAESLAGAFYGVGIELGYIDKVVSVVAPLKGMPADRAGVKAGDMIIHVKDETKRLDEDTDGWTLTDAVNNIRGKRGTQVTLTLFRPDDENAEPFDVTLTRDEIIIPSVELSFVEGEGDQYALISLSRFGDRTEDEWNEAVSEILNRKGQVAGIILDMRNNPGGYFDGAIEVASDFIENDVVVTQQGKYSSQDFKSEGRSRLKGMPLVVLVNRGSASASEIVAGALRDDLGIKLVGEKTFGKGTVQDRRELRGGGGLHVTVAKWVLPGGSWIHEEGLPVDVEVEDNEETKEDEVVVAGIQALKSGVALKN